jgi:peptide/nickel transport system permease protein
MLNYTIRRLILLPITLFAIILVNFIIINLAPGDPVTLTEISQEGNATRKDDRSLVFGSDDRYLQFREFYGLTLPIILNTWPWLSQQDVEKMLQQLITRHGLSVKEYDALRITMGDQSRFVMGVLLHILSDPKQELPIRRMASRFFYRGGSRHAILGPGLPEASKAYNRKISRDNLLLESFVINPSDTSESVEKKVDGMKKWYEENAEYYHFNPNESQKIAILLFETRFFRYFTRVLTLDFGTLRNDANKTVMSEVVKRFKYSLTLALIPMLLTFVLCQCVGFTMAYQQNRWPDYFLNFCCLILYAIPVFVVAPFLIEKIALNHTFPFTHIPIPISGFTSPDAIYRNQTSLQRLYDIIQHLCLPLIAIMYGSLAAQSRLSRTAVLEVLRQDYIRTARAKGVPPLQILFRHVGRNAAVTIVTSIAGSLGIVLGGSLIVETIFEINGFGKFFYDAVINRDYNVIMFSTLAGSFLSLLGYLVADIAYTLLDPRVTLE